MLGLVKSYSNHFYEGQEYFQDLDVFTQQLSIEIDTMRTKTDTLDKQLEKRHKCVSDLDKEENTIRIEGYLFKRGKNAFRVWNRRYITSDSKKLKNLDNIVIVTFWQILISYSKFLMPRPLKLDTLGAYTIILFTKIHKND